MDWLPTILDMLDQPIPENGLVGKSLKPLLISRTAKLEDRDLFWHFPHYRGSDVVPYAIIRSRNYKLIYYFDGSQAELYDLKFDLVETNNIINSRPLIATDLARKIEIWLNESGARLPVEQN